MKLTDAHKQLTFLIEAEVNNRDLILASEKVKKIALNRNDLNFVNQIEKDIEFLRDLSVKLKKERKKLEVELDNDIN